MIDYVDTHATRITNYSFVKELCYRNLEYSKKVEYRLSKLQQTKFDFIHIPEFEFKRQDTFITIECEFIKGCCASGNVNDIYKDLVSHDWTFTDPHPSNFIECKKSKKIYAIDLDSFDYVPDINERKAFWIDKEWPAQIKYHQFNMDGLIGKP